MKTYQSKIADENGYIHYTDEEHQTWKTLYQRQTQALTDAACLEFRQGVTDLGLEEDRIPQLTEVNATLQSQTGWQAIAVPALIPFKQFFHLLANKQFPTATFIRHPDELTYLKEPDIFHEIFGHCTMLTHAPFADFTQRLGQLGLEYKAKDQEQLARLYWFTVEFGLINTPSGLRIYGGGILSSIEETHYALHAVEPKRQPMDIVTALRTPYRYDEKQLNYFIINSFDELFSLSDPERLKQAFYEAKQLGQLPNPHLYDNDDTRSC